MQFLIYVKPWQNDPNSSNENNNQMRSLVRMGFSELEASLAVERCGNVTLNYYH